MIIAFITHTETAHTLVQSASMLAKQLQKTFTVLAFVDSDKQISSTENAIKSELLNSQEWIENTRLVVRVEKLQNLSEICEELDASFLILQLIENKSKTIQHQLTACRNLRIPYILFKNDFDFMHLEKVLLPVNFLEEEVEKAHLHRLSGVFAVRKSTCSLPTIMVRKRKQMPRK
jgi:hypothetical protein